MGEVRLGQLTYIEFSKNNINARLLVQNQVSVQLFKHYFSLRGTGTFLTKWLHECSML